jgi:hypothetical protein
MNPELRPGYGVLLVSVTVGFAAAALLYPVVDLPLQYSELTAGDITWRAAGKARDLALVYGFLAAFAIALWALSVHKRGHFALTPADAQHYELVLGATALPTLAWGASQLLSPAAPTFVTMPFIALAALMAAWVYCRSGREHAARAAGLAYIAALLCPVALYALVLAWTKSGRHLSVDGLARLPIAALALELAWIAGAYAVRQRLSTYMRWSVLAFQVLCVGYFAVLYPTPLDFSGTRYSYHITAALKAIIVALAVGAVVDVMLCARRPVDNDRWHWPLSPLCMAAILIGITLPVTLAPVIPADDYHFGETLLPLWMWREAHALPYVDYAPAHGIYSDMATAVAARLFLTDRAADYAEAARIADALLAVAVFLGVRTIASWSIAGIIAAVTVMTGAWFGLGFELAVLGFVALQISASSRWLPALYVGLGYGLFLASPGLGAVFVMAAAYPVASWLWHSGNLRRTAVPVALAFLAVSASWIAVPSLYAVTMAAVRYLAENSAVNYQAYGIPWDASWGWSLSKTSGALFEAIRWTWMLVPAAAVWLVASGKLGKQPLRHPGFPVIVFAVVFLVLLTQYSVGRIDPAALSRPGKASMQALVLGALVLVAIVWTLRGRLLTTAGIAIWAAMFGALPADPLHGVGAALGSNVRPGALTDFAALGYRHMGVGVADPGHLARLKQVKQVVDALADADESYLDLTNRTALYAYVGRPMPIEAAPYNLTHERMQQRSLERLSRRPPPLVLVAADNFNHDGRSASIRTHLLYRWVVSNYEPARIGNLVVAVRPDRVERLRRFTASPASDTQSAAQLWDQAFRLASLDGLPIAWGASLPRLERSRINRVLDLDHAAMHDLARADHGRLHVEGPAPRIEFALPAPGVRGREAGILAFAFECAARSVQPTLAVRWAEEGQPHSEDDAVRFVARTGELAVPLDAMPRWLLGERIATLQLDLHDAAACGTLAVRNARLYQRTSVRSMPGLRADPTADETRTAADGGRP